MSNCHHDSLGSGNVHMLGSNTYGKLGLGSRYLSHSTSPQLVDGLLGPQIVQVSCGDHHTIAVTNSGECYAWGQGSQGALGLSYKPECEYAPILIKELKHTFIVGVSCGARHTLLLSKFKEVYACGDG